MAPKVVLDLQKYAGTISVPRKNRKTIKAAIEDISRALSKDTLVTNIQEENEKIETSLGDCISELFLDIYALRDKSDSEGKADITTKKI